jgi:hypothetical protein
MPLAKTAPFGLDDMARCEWLSLAPNTFQTRQRHFEDLSAFHEAFSARTHPENSRNQEQRIATKINKHIVIRTVFPRGLKIRNYFLLIPNTASGSSILRLEHKTSNRYIFLHSEPNHKLQLASCSTLNDLSKP